MTVTSSSNDRGMMKWAPYQSLIEQGKYLAELRERRSRVPRPLISSDRAEEINYVLVNYESGLVKAKYWRDGHTHEFVDSIKKIDETSKRVYFSTRSIDFKDLLNLEEA